MYCKHCGKQIADDAKFCDGCGMAVSEEVVESKTVVNEPKKKKRGVGIYAVIIILILASCGAIIGPSEDKESNSAGYVETIPVDQETKFIGDFCSLSGMSESTAKSIYSVLSNDLHFQRISLSNKNKKQDVVTYINWLISSDGYDVVVTADNEGIYGVFIPDMIRFVDNGTVIAVKEDIVNREIQSKHRSTYIVMAKNLLEQYLKSPSSAKYCNSNDLILKRNGSIVSVSGWVEAQNSYGAMIRSDFIVQMNVVDVESFNAQLVYLLIGNQAFGEYIEMN